MRKKQMSNAAMWAAAMSLLLVGCSVNPNGTEQTEVTQVISQSVQEQETNISTAFSNTDPEFAAIMENFIDGEVSADAVLLDDVQKQLICRSE